MVASFSPGLILTFPYLPFVRWCVSYTCSLSFSPVPKRHSTAENQKRWGRKCVLMGSPTVRMLANVSLGEPANGWFLGQGAVPSSLTSPLPCSAWVQQASRWKPENNRSKDGKREGTRPVTLLNCELCHLTQPRGTMPWACRHEAALPCMEADTSPPPIHLREVPSHVLTKLSAQLEK